ncbi:MAG: DUF1134 domain-containing protein [Halothiobacillaceae bacterium]
MKRLVILLVAGLLGACASEAPKPSSEPVRPSQINAQETYDEGQIAREANDFLGESAEGLASAVSKAFQDQGRPNAYIRGEEGGGAIIAGVRYGQGELVTKSGQRRKVYWQGPSIGLDFGANAGKVFILIYNLPDVDMLFQRFVGVDGSAYFVGGVSMNYARSGNIVVAPIRVGVGIRLGANMGYIHFTPTMSWNPF